MHFELLPVVGKLRQVTDTFLRDLAGDRSFARGRAFASQERVFGLAANDPTTLVGDVAGNGGLYRVSVTFAPTGQILGGECSCPVGFDCKHVVAVVLTARSLTAATPGPASARGSAPARGAGRSGQVPKVVRPPQWELVLADVLSDNRAQNDYSPLGLLVELRSPRGAAAQISAGGLLEVALRPVVPGKMGWVRTGVSWSGLDYPRYGGPALDPRQVDALQAIARAHGSTTYQYYSPPEWLDLASLGDGWMEALRRCRRVGIQLLAAQRGGGEVVLAEASASVAFDLVRAAGGDDLVLTPSVRLPQEMQRYAVDVSGWSSVGSPPTGLVARSGINALLVTFEPSLDIATARVLGHGPLMVPAADAERFLSVAAPTLAKRFELLSGDGSVEIAEPGPPRLHLVVTHLPGLQLGLRWSFSYTNGYTDGSLNGAALTVAIDSSEHLMVRDPEAERGLLAAVGAVGLPAAAAPAPPDGKPVPAAAVPVPAGSVPAGSVPAGSVPAGLVPAGLVPAGPLPESTLTGFAVVQFLDQVLPRLAELEGIDVVVTGDAVDYVEAAEPPQVQLALTQSPDGTDWFDLSVDVTVGSEPVPLALLVTALTLGEEHLVLPSGTWFRVDRPELGELRRLLDEARAMQDGDSGSVRLSPYQADLWAELEALGVVREQAERWARLVKGLAGAGATDSLSAPAGLLAELRPYQHDGFEWLTFLRRHGLGGVLADDMGLGKTLQVLAMIVQERHELGAGLEGAGLEGAGLVDAGLVDAAEGPATVGAGTVAPGTVDPGGAPAAPWLVVAPTSVLGAWTAEAARFAPGVRVRVLGQTATRRGVSVTEAAQEADLVVTSYAVLRLDADQFRAVRWAGVVLDEAQAVKNHQSATYQAVRRLDAPSRFVVTGTPMENNLMDLWSLLSIAAPGLFPDPKAFAEYYRRPIESGTAPERLQTLRRRVRPLMLRRTKEAVAADLPPKQEQVVRVELPPRHRRLYDRGLARERQRVLGLLEDANRNRIAIFRSLTVLRQLSLHPGLVDPADDGMQCIKIDTLMELLLPVVAEGHQAIVFSQFTSFLRRVRDRFDAAGTPYSYLDGTTRDRQRVIESFRSGAGRVFLVSLKAGGTGLTLTEADYVFLLDPWWNPAVEAQAVDRAHRIGQDKPVNVYRLVSSNTIEEKVLALQDRKRELFASVVDAGALTGGGLTSDDIRSLVR
jgi:superfamily II DNA or RNA helicase